jgi:hypothetical protein
MSERRFDISWIHPPATRDDAGQAAQTVIDPGSSDSPPSRDVEDARTDRRQREHRVDTQLLHELVRVPQSHIVDLAAQVGVEFDEALRSVLRLAARRAVFIEQRDPVANDHLVAANPEFDNAGY